MSRAVIKAGKGRISSQGYCSLDLRDISAQAESILSAANTEVAQIISEAKADGAARRQVEAKAGREDGYREGLAKGEQEGGARALAEARERFGQEQSSLVSTLTNLTQQFTAKRERLYLEARQDAVLLGIAIAARICNTLAAEELSLQATNQACQEALAILSEATQLVIRSHPADAAAIERFCDNLNQSMKSSRHVRIVEDAGVGRGGVIVESAESSVDATINSRIERIADELIAGWRDRMKKRSIQS